MQKINSGVTAPKGFLAGGVHCGVKTNNPAKKDIAIIYSEKPCTAAAVYTQNKVFGAPITVTRRNIADGMAQAVAGLDLRPDHVLIDGNRCPPGLAQTAESVVKGDANSASIAAASILAKVSRDRYMLELDKQYPQYQLAKHKGYPTKLHYELIARYGIQPFYRRSFLKKQGYWHD